MSAISFSERTPGEYAPAALTLQLFRCRAEMKGPLEGGPEVSQIGDVLLGQFDDLGYPLVSLVFLVRRHGAGDVFADCGAEQ
jgi:hypothetical protein